MKLFAISIIILMIIKEGVSEWTSNSTLTWIEAQLYCSDSNSSLIQGHSQHARGEYWTGEYKRLSSWMHIIGCYSWNYLSENTDVQRTLSLSTPSLGICQELCLPVNVFAFSIKTNKCLCLGKIPERNGLSPQTCDGKCHESCPNDCGSNSDQNIFNVYTTSPNTMTMSDKYDVKKLCLSLYSTDFLDTYYFRPDSCASASRGLCQRSDNKDELFKMNDYTNWENALKSCKRNGSYLFGNITSEADAGNKINGSNVKDKTTFWHWLGIARKIYLTTDTGIPTDTRLVIQCKMYDGLLGNFVDDCDSQGRKLQAVCRGDKPKLMTIQKVNITSEYKMTWIEANHFCKSKNSTMIQRKIDNMTSDYWRGEYNRLSDWIHIIGCYNWSYLRYHTDPSTSMTLPLSSLGLCQELCQPLTTFAFSIKNKECVCLRHIPEDSGLSPHFCDGRCETYQQHFKTFHTVPNDCGSTYDSSIFNVYTSSPRTVTQHDRYNSSMLCLRLFCMDTLNVCHLVPSKCSNPFWNRICENNADNYALRNIATWEASVEICRNNGSYLYGNMTSSSQAIQTMKKFHLMKINNQFWLGAARQVYPTVDRGQFIETKEIVRCNLCTINKIGNGNRCDYDTDCNSRDTTAFAVCEDNIHQTKVIEYSVSTRMASLNSPIPAKGTDQINTAMTSKPQQKSSRRVTPKNIHNLTISRKPVPQTKEPTTDSVRWNLTSAAERHDVSCLSDSISVFIPSDLLSHYQTTWRDPHCQVQDNGTHYVSTISHTSCGTTVIFTKDEVIFENELILHKSGSPSNQTSNGSVDFGSSDSEVIPVQCIYPRRQNISTLYRPAQSTVRFYEKRYGHMDVQLEQYKSGMFVTPLPVRSFPNEVEINKDMYFILHAMHVNSTDVAVKVDSCVATPSNMPADGRIYQLLDQGCPASPAVKVYPSAFDEVRFSVRAFEFRTSPGGIVYIHCQVSVCSPTSPQCRVGCAHRHRREVSTEDGGSHLVSGGPYLLVADKGGLQVSTVVAGVCASVAVVATVIAIIGWRRKSSASTSSSKL